MNDWLAKISSTAMKKAGRAELKLKKYSPEILLGLGIIGFVGTVVTACNATLKADEVLEYHNRKIEDIKEAKMIVEENPEEYEYDDETMQMDIRMQYLKTTGSLVKLYAPTVVLGGLSLACILTSRNIMQRRYLGLLAAYNGVTAAFEEYRKRVVEECGEEVDRHFRYGTTRDTLTEIKMDENGKNKKSKVDIENIDPKTLDGDIHRFFDSGNKNWDPNPNFSMMWLRGRQNMLNDLLHTRGHVFLNEVYDALGFDHTPQGAILGWVEGADEYIDFGLYDPRKEGVRRFVNGADNVILLEFNCTNVIINDI